MTTKFGFLHFPHATALEPTRLGPELEERGFDSLWLPEHSHIPVSRITPYPNDPETGELPAAYSHILDPFVVLSMVATSTTRLRLCTGVCLILEHDLLDLACQTATLDVLSNGRLTLGVGVGWNEEELANHRPDLPFRKRYSAMRERIQALRAAWSEDEAAYEGTWDSYEPSWIFPKPVNRSIPVALGNAGPLGIQHSTEYADEWCPIDASMLNDGQRPDVRGAITMFRDGLEKNGRDPDSVPITIFLMDPTRLDRMEKYMALGVERLVFMQKPITMETPAETLARMDQAIDAIKKIGGDLG
jgi:probable F420-dependent oxidoreductase